MCSEIVGLPQESISNRYRINLLVSVRYLLRVEPVCLQPGSETEALVRRLAHDNERPRGRPSSVSVCGGRLALIGAVDRRFRPVFRLLRFVVVTRQYSPVKTWHGIIANVR